MSDHHVPDPERCASLGDVGQPDYFAATAIECDGEEHLVLVLRNAMGDAGPAYHPGCPDAPHEQLGPLPERYRLGILASPIRCARPTRSGHPCRAVVAKPGACHRHQDTAGEG